MTSPDQLLPPIVTVTFPVAFSKPVTTTVALSPTIIGSALALIVKFSLDGIGFLFTITPTVVEFNTYTPSPPTPTVTIALPTD